MRIDGVARLAFSRGELRYQKGSRCETRSQSALSTPRREMNSGLQPRRQGESDRHRLELLMSNRATDPQTPRTTVRVNGVELGVETFGRVDDPLVLLAGGTTMLSWPDSLAV